MALINADPDLLEQVARELTKISENVESQNRALAKAESNTTAIWKSQYTGRYLESVSKTKKKINTTSGNIQKMADTLRQIASDIRRVEQEIQNSTAKK